MSHPHRYRVRLVVTRTLVLDLDASTPEVAKEIANYVFQEYGERPFKYWSTDIAEVTAGEVTS